MWGGTPSRNMVSPMKGLPTQWDVKSGKNVKWVAELGSQSYGNPVVASGVVLIGTNNEAIRDAKQGGDRGVLMAFRESSGEFLWQATFEKLSLRPRQRLAVPGHCLIPARDRGGRLLRLQSRPGGGRRSRWLPRQDQRRRGQGREADRQDRSRLHLDLRHDGRGGLVPAQPRQLVAGRASESDLRQHVQRPGRKSRQHSVAQGALDHRPRSGDREAGVGRQLGRRPHSAWPMVDPDGWRRSAACHAGRARAG